MRKEYNFSKMKKVCSNCGHAYAMHYGYYIKNPCQVKNCKCLDYLCKQNIVRWRINKEKNEDTSV